MFKKFAVLLALFIGLGSLVAMAPAASATTSCKFTPVLPARVVVNQDVKGLTAKLKRGAGCPSLNGYTLDAETHLVHTTDSYWLLWDETLKPDVESVYAFEVKPGTYRTTASTCDLYDPDFNPVPCSLNSASTVMKFGARPKLTIAKNGHKRTFHARATRYSANGWQPTTATVSIQRWIKRKWRTVHTATAKGKSGYTWSHVYNNAARYRAVQAETSMAFHATSAVAWK